MGSGGVARERKVYGIFDHGVGARSTAAAGNVPGCGGAILHGR